MNALHKDAMSLTLTDAQQQWLIREMQANAPCEICGLIGGRGNRAEQIIPLPNIAADPTTRYQADPAALGRALREIEKTGDLLAIYHSHPNSAPVPSQTDIAEWMWGSVVCVIVGMQGVTARVHGWVLTRRTAMGIAVSS